MFFLVYQIWWFLKDVFNEMLGFEAEGGPEIDAKSKNKSHPLEVVEKDAKIVEKAFQKWSKKLSKSNKKTVRKSNKKMIRKSMVFEPTASCRDLDVCLDAALGDPPIGIPMPM